MDRDGVVQYLVGDHLGTTSLVLNANGTVHSEARHYPYGEERWSSGTLPTDYRFTGQRNDSYIKLVHMGVRHYDPALGRWLSADTIVPEPGSSQSYNRYAYVRNSPLKFVDPTGHMEDGECGPWGEDCIDAPLPYKPSPPPEFYPPFSDSMAGPERHLVESCDWLDCADAMFNPYTPGGWNFQAADRWLAATWQVYEVGSVSWPEAQRAARDGRPNPVTSEQMAEGLSVQPTEYFNAEYYLISYVRPWPPFYYFFARLGWKDHEGMCLSNFEPRYLKVLLESHPEELAAAYQQVLNAYHDDPVAFMDRWNIFKYGSKR